MNPTETSSTLSREAYNKGAATYRSWTASHDTQRMHWLNKLFDHLCPTASEPHDSAHRGLKFLDLGCGAGIPATLTIAQTTGSVIGIDVSDKQIELAKTYFQEAGVEVDGQKIQLRVEDMLDLNFPDTSLDGICAFYSIIHLPLADQAVLLERCFKWLESGGYMLFNVATEKSSEGGEVMDDWLGTMRVHWASLGKEGTRELLRSVGFEVVEVEDVQMEGDAQFTWFIVQKPRPSAALEES